MLGNILLVAFTSLVSGCSMQYTYEIVWTYQCGSYPNRARKDSFFLITKGIFFFIWEVYTICWTQLYMYFFPCRVFIRTHGIGVYEECNTLYIATWLILPVIIRSSQRLSHACLSMNFIRWNCEWLIISAIIYLIIDSYLDNSRKSRANTCIKTQLTGG